MGGSRSYPSETRELVEGLLRSELTMVEIAARAGIGYSTVKLWNRQARIRSGRRTVPVRPDPRAWRMAAGAPATPSLATLDLALRAHIARQIAAFDERLSGRDAAQDSDSARILRDLGGLRRLLDDLGAGARQPDAEGDADGGAPQDLAALRERLAQRLAAFAAAPDPAAAGEPGA